MKKIWIYDIECILTFFSIVFLDNSGEDRRTFYIHESNDDSKELYNFLKNEVKGMIGFNNLNYDYPLLHFFILNHKKYSTTKELLEALFNKSQEIINSSFSRIFKKERKIPQLDLYLIYHFDNKATATSLKDCEMAMRMANLQSLPIKPEDNIREENIQEILDYNYNDVLSTYYLYLRTKEAGKISLRRDIKEIYDNHYLLDDALNFNDVKIGDTINKIVYSQLTGLNWKDFKDLRTHRSQIYFSECIPLFIEFKTNILNTLLDELKGKVISGTKGGFKKQITFGNTKYTIAQGGLHSDDPARIVSQDEDNFIIDADVSSYYPATVLNLGLYPQHLGKEWLEGYRQTYNRRLEAKAKKKESKKYKAITDALKLSLNGGGYGKTNEGYNWQYDPKVMLTTTLTGQLSLLMLIEDLELEGISVISANTDGLVSKVPKDKEDKYYEICKKWEELTNYELEYTYYNKLVQTSVNDYIAQKTNNELKFKGDFEINKELHKNHSQRIRAVALANYFINNIPIKDTIKNPQNQYDIGEEIYNGYGIYDYCLYVKARKNQEYHFHKSNDENPFMTDTILMPRNVRYIIVNNGGILIKSYLSGKQAGQEEKVNAGYRCQIMNKIDNNNVENYDINYNFYIEECNKMIREIEGTNPVKRKTKLNKKMDNNQLKLF